MKKLYIYCMTSMVVCLISLFFILFRGGYPVSNFLSWMLWGLMLNGVLAWVLTGIFIIPKIGFRKGKVDSWPVGSSWNYRMATEFHKDSKSRLFHIIEVYYKDGKPDAYAHREPMRNWDDLEDLKGTHKLIALAFEKPVLDLDNWPNVYKPSK